MLTLGVHHTRGSNMSTTMVLIWVLCAIAGMLLAPHRRQTPVQGFLLGLLLGPLGLLIILVFPPRKKKSEPVNQPAVSSE